MRSALPSEAIADRASFEGLRYANCWEDASVVAEALRPLQGARCLSVASAGDNTLSLLARGAASIVAVDLSAAQLALCALKLAAFRVLPYEELLAFLGVRDGSDRAALWQRLRGAVDRPVRDFWDARPRAIAAGVVHAGRFENYFRVFRRCVLPLIHRRRTVAALLLPREPEQRAAFYEQHWDGWRWRVLFRVFFSRWIMGRLGRDAEFFRFVQGPVAARIFARARHALAVLPAHDNPYLRYILTGGFGDALPDYLRPEHYAPIRAGLERVHLRLGALEEIAAGLPSASIDAFNLSDVVEYMDLASYHRLLQMLERAAAPGARLAYWNLLVPRARPASLATRLVPQAEAARLHAQARAFFYEALVVELVP